MPGLKGGWNRGKRWKPTEKDLQEIKTLSGLGLSYEKIATVKQIHRTTFEIGLKRYPALQQAIDEGRETARTQISQSAFEMAKKIPSMTRFWLQCRADWKPVEGKEISGPNGQPLESVNTNIEIDPVKLKAAMDKLEGEY